MPLGAVVLSGVPRPAVSVSPGFVRDADQRVPAQPPTDLGNQKLGGATRCLDSNKPPG